ncbi:MAG: amidohydrolase family protein [Acidobacteriaceae bacterium]|nr:amidohydrolase family protein [Acidobacteriaceae bacterium]
MLRYFTLFTCVLSLCPCSVWGQSGLTPGTEPFIALPERSLALLHVRVIDGTGSAARDNQTVIIANGQIRAVGASESTPVPADMRQIDLSGHTVFPGLVGMHEHLFYPSGGGVPIYSEQAYSAPRLYLASGITTMRTGGSLEPYTDINIKRLIDSGKMPGPKMDATGPYIEGPGSFSIQMPSITSPEQARRTVDFWAQEGATSFKAYMNISHDALGAAIQEAHRHGLKITGHLCSVGFTEAAELGIDNLEHGLLVDTEFMPGKQRDVCPNGPQATESVTNLNLKGPEAQRMIHTLVEHHVAVTSTLAVFEAFLPGRPPLEGRTLDIMSPEATTSYLAAKERAASRPGVRDDKWLKKEMDFEREFAAAGGLLMAGCDPTGNGGAPPGFGDQRNLELLVEAGFKPEEAIRIYTLNGAQYLGQADRIGSITPGKQADLVVVAGNPSTQIADCEKVKYVFKEGVAYDPAKLIGSVRGTLGIH